MLSFAFFLSLMLSILCTGFFLRIKSTSSVFSLASEGFLCFLVSELPFWEVQSPCILTQVTNIKVDYFFLANSHNCPPFFSFLFLNPLQYHKQQCCAVHCFMKADTRLLALRQVLFCCSYSCEWWRICYVLQSSHLKSRSQGFHEVHPRRGYPRSWCQEGAQIIAEPKGNLG